ncbi:hypothetical protein WUBG_10779 [Wuchereria bancrofti]|uniref:RRM domain-containing protein n=1 Tax=Wuchereria bancrofti TaxID=6293 RepID=J9EMP9_WUCBA|nr:hypothetical protein WUBG_10779 [Wuchereria bancrofti]
MTGRLVRQSGAAVKIFKEARRNSAKLFVKRISWVTGASELKDYFSQFGKVRNIMLPFDLRTGLHKGFAFISFENNDFYENIKKFEGKHVIDDEEVICLLPNGGKSLFLTNTDPTLFVSENSCRMDISKTNFDNEIEAVEFIKTEKSVKEKEIKRGERTKETNLLQKLQKADNPKQSSGKNNLLGRKAVSTKLTDFVRENECDSEMCNKTYRNVRPSNGLYVNGTKNGFTDRISLPSRSFRIPTIEATKRKLF